MLEEGLGGSVTCNRNPQAPQFLGPGKPPLTLSREDAELVVAGRAACLSQRQAAVTPGLDHARLRKVGMLGWWLLSWEDRPELPKLEESSFLPSVPQDDICMHLTNYAINKHNENFVRDENTGSKRYCSG